MQIIVERTLLLNRCTIFLSIEPPFVSCFALYNFVLYQSVTVVRGGVCCWFVFVTFAASAFWASEIRSHNIWRLWYGGGRWCCLLLVPLRYAFVNTYCAHETCFCYRYCAPSSFVLHYFYLFNLPSAFTRNIALYPLFPLTAQSFFMELVSFLKVTVYPWWSGFRGIIYLELK